MMHLFLPSEETTMNDFDLNVREARVQAGKESIPLLVVGTQRDLWFRGNNLTAYLGYAQPRVATKATKLALRRVATPKSLLSYQ